MSWKRRQSRHEQVVVKRCKYCKGRGRSGRNICQACRGTGRGVTMIARQR